MAFHRPGTYVSEITTLGSVASDTPQSSVTVFVEKCHQGPTSGPVLITNWNQFVTLFGGFVDTSLFMPYAVWQFFNNGGAQCYVQRVIGANSVASLATLKDKAATPQNTMTVTAASAGAWGNSLNVQATARGTNRFDLYVYNGSAVDQNRVETWLDLSMDSTDPRYAPTVINSVAAGSNYIVVADLHSATTTPNNQPSVATTALTTGSDGNAPGNGDYANAVSQLDQLVEEALLVNLPGQTSNTIITSAITYVETRGDSFLVIDCSSGLTPTSAVAEQAGYEQSSYAAYYYPWLNSVDPGSPVAGATKLLPPGGAVCGEVVATDLTKGPFRAPAGLSAKLSGVVSLERKLASSDLDSLNDGNVNAIRNHAVGGICIFGARTLSRTTSTRYVPVRRSLNYIKDNVRRLSSFAVFEDNDATTWSTITNTLNNFLTAYWQQGGLNGTSASQAYYVVCDETNNTPQTIAAGELHIEVGVAVLNPAEFIVIQVGQFDGGATAVEQ